MGFLNTHMGISLASNMKRTLITTNNTFEEIYLISLAAFRRIFLVSSLFAASVGAQVLPDQPTLNYFSSKAFAQATIMAGVALEESAHEAKQCSGTRGYDPITFSIEESLKFVDGKEHPESGAWTFRFRFRQCGMTSIYNLLWNANQGSVPKPSYISTGMTRADRTLARSLRGATSSAGLSIFHVSPTCQTLIVKDTRVTREPAPLVRDGVVLPGVWEEEWTADMCGTVFTTPICLTPSATGGTTWMTNRCGKS